MNNLKKINGDIFDLINKSLEISDIVNLSLACKDNKNILCESKK